MSGPVETTGALKKYLVRDIFPVKMCFCFLQEDLLRMTCRRKL